MTITQAILQDHFDTFIDPYMKDTYSNTGTIKAFSYEANCLTVSLHLGYPIASISESLKYKITKHIQERFPDLSCEITLTSKINSHQVGNSLQSRKGIKNIIAVASGKGGVGKSTVTVNLAASLQQAGARVGILDADIYGPSQPNMLGITLTDKPNQTTDKLIEPVVHYGIQTMSIGYLVEQDTPMIWRGPMVSGALQQLLNETAWQDLDYLFVDLPPGTGDIQLTLAQKIPVTGAVIVTTPQDIALLDARKAYGMFRKVNVNVLGLIENMAVYHCPSCNHESHIFGEGGGQRMAKQYDIPLLGQLPLTEQIQRDGDQGVPTVLTNGESEAAKVFSEAALSLTGQLALLPRDYSSKFPKVVIEEKKVSRA